MKSYKRNCSNCGQEKIYYNKSNYNRDVRNSSVCNKCSKLVYKNTNFSRNCPNPTNSKICKEIIYYSSEKNLELADNKNSICYSCSQLGMLPKDSVYFIDCKNPDSNKNCLGKIFYKTKFGYERAIKNNKLLCRKCCNSGSKYSDIERTHQREARLKFLESVFHILSYNKNSIHVLDFISNSIHSFIQHAENNGEYRINGYSLDGYIKNLNIPIEFDENNHHYRHGKLLEKDLIRQSRISEKLKCKYFLRIRIKKNGYILDIYRNQEIINSFYFECNETYQGVLIDNFEILLRDCNISRYNVKCD